MGLMRDYYSITELTREFDISTRTLRFYEDEGLIQPDPARPHAAVPSVRPPSRQADPARQAARLLDRRDPRDHPDLQGAAGRGRAAQADDPPHRGKARGSAPEAPRPRGDAGRTRPCRGILRRAAGRAGREYLRPKRTLLVRFRLCSCWDTVNVGWLPVARVCILSAARSCSSREMHVEARAWLTGVDLPRRASRCLHDTLRCWR